MLPVAVKKDFLSVLTETGNVVEACRQTGVNRSTAYQWRRDPRFDRLWEEALVIQRDAIRDDLVTKAMAATGRVVTEPLIDPETGSPVLDDDFNTVTVRRLIDYDGQVLKTMLNKFVRSEDGAPTVAIQNNIGLEPARVVEGPPLDVDAILAEYEEVDDA